MWKRPSLFGSIFHRFLRPTCLQLGPNLDPKTQQNRSKIDAQMHCILDFIFWSIFGWCLLPTWTYWISKNVVFLMKNKVFWKIAVRSSHRFWIPFWLQLCFIFASKIHQNLSKNRFQEALKSWSILRSIFNWFWLRFGGQVGAMLATFLGPRPPKRPPRPLQDASKTLPRQSKMPSKTLWIA